MNKRELTLNQFGPADNGVFEKIFDEFNINNMEKEWIHPYGFSYFQNHDLIHNFANLKQDVLRFIAESKEEKITYQGVGTNENYKTYPLTIKYSSNNLGPVELINLNSYPHLLEFLKKIRFDLDHCRISVMRNSTEQLGVHQWHVDCNILFKSRLNIPIIADELSGVEILSNSDSLDGRLNVARLPFNEGVPILYDTNQLHRPIMAPGSSGLRVNLILTFYPWLNFFKERKIVCTNQFYGKMDPFQILKSSELF